MFSLGHVCCYFKSIPYPECVVYILPNKVPNKHKNKQWQYHYIPLFKICKRGYKQDNNIAINYLIISLHT